MNDIAKKISDNQGDDLPPMGRKILLELAYDGTDYIGWQVQTHGESVQSAFESRISKIYAGSKIKAESSGRTDAGVHALAQAISFMPPESPRIALDKLQRSLNRMLPPSIRVISAKTAPEGFHARFSASAKAYCYVINTAVEDPFTGRWSWHLPSFSKICEVRKAAAFLVGTHDFSSFTVERKDREDAVRTIHRITVRRFGKLICVCFIGDGFLYKMVRSMVGSLAFVGRGVIPPDEIQTILSAKDRRKCYDTAPAKGLFLVKVFYGKSDWKRFSLKTAPFHGQTLR